MKNNKIIKLILSIFIIVSIMQEPCFATTDSNEAPTATEFEQELWDTMPQSMKDGLDENKKMYDQIKEDVDNQNEKIRQEIEEAKEKRAQAQERIENQGNFLKGIFPILLVVGVVILVLIIYILILIIKKLKK